MKIKALAIIAASLVGLSAHADIQVSWTQTAAAFFNGSAAPANVLAADSVHLLIWSQSTAPVVDYATTSGIGAGEIILYTGTGMANSQFTYNGLSFSNTDVGGADITSGYIYSRIFQDSVVDIGDFYYQSPLANIESPTLPTYNVTDPSTVISHEVTTAGGYVMGTGVNMYTVVPEPSVLAFLGLGGLALAARRRFTA